MKTHAQSYTAPTLATGLVRRHIVEFAYRLGLSVREATVLVLAAGSGLHRKAAADRLGCSPGTVDTYWRRILRKSGQSSQLELLAVLLSYVLTRREPPDPRELSPPPDQAPLFIQDFERYCGAINAAMASRSETRSRVLPLD